MRQIFSNTIIFTGLLLLATSLFAQETERSIKVNYINDAIKLDGVLDEAAWCKSSA